MPQLYLNKVEKEQFEEFFNNVKARLENEKLKIDTQPDGNRASWVDDKGYWFGCYEFG